MAINRFQEFEGANVISGGVFAACEVGRRIGFTIKPALRDVRTGVLYEISPRTVAYYRDLGYDSGSIKKAWLNSDKQSMANLYSAMMEQMWNEMMSGAKLAKEDKNHKIEVFFRDGESVVLSLTKEAFKLFTFGLPCIKT